MLTEREVSHEITQSLKDRYLIFWFVLRFISSFIPLITTYIFSRGIAAIEVSQPLNIIMSFFVMFMVFEIVEHLLRIYSKTRISYYVEKSIINVHKSLVTRIGPPVKTRKEVVQTLRNLTQAIRRFMEYMYTNGVQGIVSFTAIPIILFFIDKKVFFIEAVLIVLYLIFSIILSGFYERLFEIFDSAREEYFSKLLISNNIKSSADLVLSSFKKVKNLWFVDWFTSQSFITIFTFLIIYIVVKDISAGQKQLSDLVLILGYVKESKMFLNEITTSLNNFMEVEAGIARVSKISGKVGLVIHKEV